MSILTITSVLAIVCGLTFVVLGLPFWQLHTAKKEYWQERKRCAKVIHAQAGVSLEELRKLAPEEFLAAYRKASFQECLR